MIKLAFAPRFKKEAEKLPPHRRKHVTNALRKFVENPSLPSLDFRPLAKAPGYFIIDPHAGDRIVVKKIAADQYLIADVGPHDNVYRRWNR